MRSTKLLVAMALLAAFVAGPVLAQEAEAVPAAPATDTATDTTAAPAVGKVKAEKKHHVKAKKHHKKAKASTTEVQ